jgi:hypothetical protein
MKVVCSSLQIIVGTRGHRFKLAKARSKLDIRKNFFSQRVVNSWNGLPESVVEADSVNNFKSRYDKYINDLCRNSEIV